MDDDEELDYEVETDEESLKIRRLERELEFVSSSEDKKLFIWLGAGLIPVVLYIFSPSYITQILLLILLPVSIIGGIGSTIFQNIRKKKRILIKHGLQCSKCGFIPHTLSASGVLGEKKCLKCYSKLDI